MNKDGAFIQATLVNGLTSFTTTNGEKAVFMINAEGEILERQIILTPSGNNTPEVYREWVY